MDLVQVGAVALHSVAMIFVLGYYAVLGRVVIPALLRSLDARWARASVADIEATALPLILVAIVVFVVTGAFLMFTDAQYAGFGDLLGTTWSVLILAKHAIVIGLIGLGVGVDFLIRSIPVEDAREAIARSLRRVGLAADAVSALGIIVVLMTAAAQLSG